MFADYKSNRLAMPDDLSSQMPYIFRLCEVLNIPVINVPGYEADDVIGASQTRLPQKDFRRSSCQTTKTCASSCAIR